MLVHKKKRQNVLGTTTHQAKNFLKNADSTSVYLPVKAPNFKQLPS